MAGKSTALIVKFLIFFGLFLLWASSAQAKITLGVVPATDSMIVSEDRGRSFRAYLEERLGEPVALRVFEDEKTLHAWIHRFRVVDLALMSRAYIARQPAGQFHLLADVVSEGGPSAEQLLMRQGAKPRTMKKVREIVMAMGEDKAGRKLLADLGVSRLAAP